MAAWLFVPGHRARAEAPGEPTPPAGWQFVLEPYGLLPVSITGHATVGSETVPFRVDLGKLFSKLELMGTLRFEAWKGPWGILFDNAYLQLGHEGTVARRSFDVTTRAYIGNLLMAIRPFTWSSPRPYAPAVRLELAAGMRLTGLGTSLTLAGKSSHRSKWFPEFTGGIILPVRLAKHFALRLRSMVALSETVSWQILGAFQYVSRIVTVSLGYFFDRIRHKGENVAVEINLQNVYLAVGFRFGAEPFFP